MKFAIEVRLKVPENAFVEHAPWKQLQHYTRLDGSQAALVGDVCSIDELRRNVLASASRVSRESDAFSRHCRLARALFATARTTELDGQLTSSVNTAVQAVDDARERLTRPQAGEADEVARERRLVDEYLSVRLLEMLGAAERSLGVLSSRMTRGSSSRRPTTRPHLALYRVLQPGHDRRGRGRRPPDRVLARPPSSAGPTAPSHRAGHDPVGQRPGVAD